MIPGKGGIFDVKLGGRMVFSKHAAGRFPENEEILALLEKAK
jgi:selenoprotein W-related protein